ncbi:MAG: hypothetical protein L0H00_03415 [Micrococcales bacterium]|uniref:HAAS signaling domain-containing protein n=1 Tax=Kocuria palustris TaxID=71999 RepID=UPI0020437FD8|nr:hypothetical protein [Kocuria palustris]MCM3332151.1 hypothetical protein [Kocuria palustris]MDN5572414.1 hypothetical protein [Micrococcales bacterium]MDN5702039.1 hypothetical protein [Micrococcales bacterium]
MSTAPDSLADEHEVWQRPFVRMHRRWCDDFILELRLRDVPGARIGDHLAEVESHCIETGTDPEEAFGDAREYAREVGAAEQPTRDGGALRVTLISLTALVVFLTGNDATSRWARDEALSFNLVELVILGLLVAGVATLPFVLGPLLRRTWPGIAFFAGLFLLGALRALAGLMPLEPVVDGIPAAPVSVGALLVLCVLSALEMRELSGDDDRVTSPLRAPDGARPPARRGVVLIAWIFPLAFVALGALAWAVA